MTFTPGWEGPKIYASQLGAEPLGAEGAILPPEVGIVPLRPLQTGDILGGAFKAVRYNPLVMFGLTILVVLVAQLLGTLATYVFGRQLGFDLIPFEDVGEGAILDQIGLTASVVVGSLVTGVTSIVVNMGLMYATTQAVSGRRVKAAEALLHMGRRMWPALVLAAIETAAVLAVVGAGAGLLALGALGNNAPTIIALSFVLLLVAAVPGVWLYVRLSFAPCAIAVERLGPIRAIGRSWRLTGGLFWRILGITLLVNLIVGMAAGTVTQVFGFGATMLALASTQPWALLAVTTASTVVSVGLTTPLTSAATALLYVDARIRREGFDITLSEAMLR